MMSSTSHESLSNAWHPSCLIMLTLSLRDLWEMMTVDFSFKMSMMFGCLRNITTRPLYVVGGLGAIAWFAAWPLAWAASPRTGGEVGVDILWDLVYAVFDAIGRIDEGSDTASIFSLDISSSPTDRLLLLEFPPSPLTYSDGGIRCFWSFPVLFTNTLEHFRLSFVESEGISKHEPEARFIGGGVKLAPWCFGGGGGRRVAFGSFGSSKWGGADSIEIGGKSLGKRGSMKDVVLAAWSMKNIWKSKRLKHENRYH